MKSNLLKAGAALMTLMAAGLVPGHAAFALRLSADNGATWTTIEDGTLADQNPVAGAVAFNGGIGDWIVNVTSALSKPVVGSAATPYVDVSSHNLSTSAGTLIIQCSDTDFDPALPPGSYVAEIGGVTGGTVSFRAWADAANTPFAKTTTLADLGVWGGEVFVNKVVSATNPNRAPYSLTLEAIIVHSTAANSGFDANFYGFSPQSASVGNYVWEDVNRNGAQDELVSAGINGVMVKLLDCSGQVLKTTTTTDDAGGNPGYYLFTDLSAGCYQVEFVAPVGYQLTVTNASGNPQTDSDANPTTGKTGNITLLAGTTDLSWDAGVFRTPPPLCVPKTLVLTSSGGDEDGPDGNIRTFSVGGVSVKVSAFSRTKTGGSWAPSWLGYYTRGLGVTDPSEGAGDNDQHTVDNLGRDNFVLFEFSEPVVVTRAFLGYVVNDSDMKVWIGNFTDPYNNHLVMNDATLAGFGYNEVNTTTSSDTRWASFNAGEVSGNALLIAALPDDPAPNDHFKIAKLDICVTVPSEGTDPGNPELPSPWQTRDIGCVEKEGSATYSSGTFTVSGSGDNITGSKDQFRYVYQAADGDCSIVAKVVSVEDTDDEAEAGVMIRETLNNNSRHVSVFVTRDEGIQFRARKSTGNDSSNIKKSSGLEAPYWVKVVRSGNTFTGYRSANGVNWTSMGSVTVSMGTSVYIGLAVTSHDDDELCAATFNNVTATP
jgi:hypothetical protein